MKTEGFFADNVDQNVVATIDKTIKTDVTNFNALTTSLGLNPAFDFRYSDLSNVDFSFSDLRGYDFSGANLQGAVGINVNWTKYWYLLMPILQNPFLLQKSRRSCCLRQTLLLRRNIFF